MENVGPGGGGDHIYVYIYIYIYIYIQSDPKVDRIFFGGCGIYVGILSDVGHLKKNVVGRKLVVGIWFGGVDRICLFKVAHSQNA